MGARTAGHEGWEGDGGWFAQLPAAERAAMHARGTARRYRAGSALFHEGDTSDWVVLLTNGRVKVSSTTSDGKDVVLGVCAPGELLGELSALDGRPRSATAVAMDPVEARVIQGADFRQFLESNASAALLLLVSVCGRLRARSGTRGRQEQGRSLR